VYQGYTKIWVNDAYSPIYLDPVPKILINETGVRQLCCFPVLADCDHPNSPAGFDLYLAGNFVPTSMQDIRGSVPSGNAKTSPIIGKVAKFVSQSIIVPSTVPKPFLDQFDDLAAFAC